MTIELELELEGHGIGKLLVPLAHSLLFEATSGCEFSDNKILGPVVENWLEQGAEPAFS